MPSFDEWFKRATGNDPFPYQRRFAGAKEIPQLVSTGATTGPAPNLSVIGRQHTNRDDAIRAA